MLSANIVLSSGLLKECGANLKILLTLIRISHFSLPSLLMSPLLKGHNITKLTINLTLTANDFATFFIDQIKTISAQFSTLQSVKHILPANINSFTYFSPLSGAELSKLILLLVCLILFHLISFKPFLLQLFLHSLTSLTHPFTLVFFPQHLNRLI